MFGQFNRMNNMSGRGKGGILRILFAIAAFFLKMKFNRAARNRTRRW